MKEKSVLYGFNMAKIINQILRKFIHGESTSSDYGR